MAARKQKLKITSVSFRANCITDANKKFEHIHVEATASVDSDEDPREVLDGLKEFVASELRAAKGDVYQVTTPGRFRV